MSDEPIRYKTLDELEAEKDFLFKENHRLRAKLAAAEQRAREAKVKGLEKALELATRHIDDWWLHDSLVDEIARLKAGKGE